MNVRTISPEQALSKLMTYCSKMERNEQDVRKKLQLWAISENDSKKIIARLQDDGFISQERYVSSYIRGKFVYNKWGKTKIKYGLLQKGFNDSLIQPLLDDFFETVDYKKTITKELQKKNKTLHTDDLYERKAKLMQFAQSRGYEFDVALSCVEKIINS